MVHCTDGGENFVRGAVGKLGFREALQRTLHLGPGQTRNLVDVWLVGLRGGGVLFGVLAGLLEQFEITIGKP